MRNFKRKILESDGYFGKFGGAYVPEIIRANTDEIADAFTTLRNDESFLNDLLTAYQEISGRPTAFTPLKNISEKLGGASLYIKNEGLNHTGAHKINHCIGQILVARKMGRKRIIAETGAGQHGVAVATVCARFGMECVIYMGYKDYLRQRPNVFWIQMLGASVVPVYDGAQTLSNAVTAAMKDLMSNPISTHYLIGSAVGPHPYPLMNTFFQKVIGEEVRRQSVESFGALPDTCIACVGGGSNAMGMFFDFLDNESVELIGVEAGGKGNSIGENATRFTQPQEGIFEGYHSYFVQDDDGNIAPTASISAGLDYCGVSPILAYLHNEGRVQFENAKDTDVLSAYELLLKYEGIIPALESAHAFAFAFEYARSLPKTHHIVVNNSGRGEKDLFITMRHFQPNQMKEFLELQLQRFD